jgi:hypothetical protein
MSSKNKVIDIDRGLAELKKTLTSLKGRGSYVKVGVMGEHAAEAHPEDGQSKALTNVDIAVISEFGSPTQPVRPFIGGTFEANRSKYQDQMANGLAKLYENKLTITQLLGLLGVSMTKDIKSAVLSRDNNFAPNALSTMRRKMKQGEKNRGKLIGPLESPRPLVATARMIGSVTHEVVTTEYAQGKGYTGPTVEVSDG